MTKLFKDLRPMVGPVLSLPPLTSYADPPRPAPKEPQKYQFEYLFCDGTFLRVVATSSGEARALMKKHRGGPLPKAVSKSRRPV